MSRILENFQKIQQVIDKSNVKILAVSKYVGSNEIIEAFQAGLRDFAENRVQDAEKKRSELPESIENEIAWHLIGHLQTNKVKKAVGNYDYIHSVDSLKLAESISEIAVSKGIVQKVLIQINVAEEEAKSGFNKNEVKEVFEELSGLNSIELVGLMTMAPFTENEEVIRTTFRGLRELRDYLQKEHKKNLPELSMGMSNDYKIAVEEGSTMIRLGQVLFK